MHGWMVEAQVISFSKMHPFEQIVSDCLREFPPEMHHSCHNWMWIVLPDERTIEVCLLRPACSIYTGKPPFSRFELEELVWSARGTGLLVSVRLFWLWGLRLGLLNRLYFIDWPLINIVNFLLQRGCSYLYPFSLCSFAPNVFVLKSKNDQSW